MVECSILPDCQRRPYSYELNPKPSYCRLQYCTVLYSTVLYRQTGISSLCRWQPMIPSDVAGYS